MTLLMYSNIVCPEIFAELCVEQQIIIFSTIKKSLTMKSKSIHYTIVYCEGSEAPVSVSYCKDYADAQHLLHEYAVDYAKKRVEVLLQEAKDNEVLKKELEALSSSGRLCYVKTTDVLTRTVCETPVTFVEGGVWSSAYTKVEDVKEIARFYLLYAEKETCLCFDLLDWSETPNVTIVTNGSIEERRRTIQALLTEKSVDTEFDDIDGDSESDSDSESESDSDDEEEGEDKDSGYEEDQEEPQKKATCKPPFYVIAITDHAESWKDYAHHCECYTDKVIDTLLTEQNDEVACQQEERLYIVVEANTHEVLCNRAIFDLCAEATRLNMNVLLSVPVTTAEPDFGCAGDYVDYVFFVNDKTENGYNPSPQFKWQAVYTDDMEVFHLCGIFAKHQSFR